MTRTNNLHDLARELAAVLDEEAHLAGARLSAAGWLREAKEIAQRDDPEALRKRAEQLPHTQAAVRRLAKILREGLFHAPCSNVRRLRAYVPDEAAMELAAVQGSAFDVQLLAVLEVSERNPEIFGEHDDMAAVERRRKELAETAETLKQKMRQALTAADLDIDPSDLAGGYVRATIKGTPVPLAPDWPQRLARHVARIKIAA